MSTDNLCFRANIKNVYPCEPQFYFIKVGCKRVYIIWTCLHDAVGKETPEYHRFSLSHAS